MVRTRGSDNFTQQFTVFEELISKRGDADVAQLCHQWEGVASSLAPGGFSAAHLCALLNLPEAIPHLASAGAPLSGELTVNHRSRELKQWFVRAKLDRSPGIKFDMNKLWLGATPLSLAAALDRRAVVEALLRAGADASGLVSSKLSRHIPYLYPLTRGLSPRSHSELVALASIATSVGEAAACLDLLRGAQAQFALNSNGACSVLDCVVGSPRGERQGVRDEVELVKFLLAAGAKPNAVDRWGTPLLLTAADQGQAGAVEALLGAGATLPDSSALARAAITGLYPGVLELALQHQGSILVDTSASPYIYDRFDYHQSWSCPVLQLLNIHARKVDFGRVLNVTHKAVLMAEMLATAGHKPTVYRNVVISPATAPVEEYDPLKIGSYKYQFDLAGANKFVWLALHPEEGWSPELHHKYPPAFKAACWAVLLAAARSSKVPASRDQRSLLGSLPQELLLNVLCQAAVPISAWLPA